MTATVDATVPALRTPPSAGAALHRLAPIAVGALAMALVGSSAAVSGLLQTAPLATSQALRYGVAALVLIALARATGRPLPRPRVREWLWLIAVAAVGLGAFNLALVRGAAHAEPAVYAVAVACVPLVLAAGTRRRTTATGRLLLAGGVVTVGAAIVSGFGRTDALGLALAVVVLACEAGFTLLAMPVLGRLGPWAVSAYTTAIAAVLFTAGGLVIDGPDAALRLDGRQVLAIGYLAVAVTAAAFVAWYLAVSRLGAARAGLLTGIAPVSAALCGPLVGGAVPGPPVLAGIAVIAVGLAVGLRPARAHH